MKRFLTTGSWANIGPRVRSRFNSGDVPAAAALATVARLRGCATRAVVEPFEPRLLFNAPAIPSDVHALAISPTQINLTWKDNANNPNNEDGFEVDFSTDGFAHFTRLAAGKDTVSKWITGLSANTTYSFRVIAANSDGYSQPSASANGMTPAPEDPNGDHTGRTVRNVVSYGATPNSNSDDDWQAIKNAIDASQAGDIIYFPAGRYEIDHRLHVSGGGRIYVGQTTFSLDAHGNFTSSGGTVIKSRVTSVNSSDRAAFNIPQNQSGTGYNVKFSQLTFEGAAIDADSVNTDRVVVTDCFFNITNYGGSTTNGSQSGGAYTPP